MGFLILVLVAAMAAIILYAIIQNAVRSGTEEALRNHYAWLHAGEDDEDDGLGEAGAS